jgi:hypothetical protein
MEKLKQDLVDLQEQMNDGLIVEAEYRVRFHDIIITAGLHNTELVDNLIAHILKG